MFTLVPSDFFDAASARIALEKVAGPLGPRSEKHLDISDYKAVLIYDCDEDGSSCAPPPIYKVLLRLGECPDYNRILCHLDAGVLSITIAQGRQLLLCNSYPAQDFTTAEYYIFLAVKSLLINPEMSTVCFMSALSDEEEMSLYRYFKSVLVLEG